jgi:glycosyltransferase involved in cell wall biosynthesis
MLPALSKSNSDIFHIHSHLYFTSNQAILAKIMTDRNALLHLHGGVGLPPYKVSWTKLIAKRFYDKTLGKQTIKNSDLIASVSRSDLDALVDEYNIPQSKLRYIPNIVDTDVFKPRANCENKEKTILYLGDLEPWKGISTLIRWFKQYQKKMDNKLVLRIVGQGSYLEQLLDFQVKNNHSSNGTSLDVIGPKNHSEIPEIMRNAKALILPSYWEGMPTVVLEAMAIGLPVISTKVGDVPYLIKNGETGLLIDRTFESFECAVNSIFNDRLLASQIQMRARSIIEKEYTSSSIHNIVSKVYTEISN